MKVTNRQYLKLCVIAWRKDNVRYFALAGVVLLVVSIICFFVDLSRNELWKDIATIGIVLATFPFFRASHYADRIRKKDGQAGK